MTKQELLVSVLTNKLAVCKVGLLVRGISDISPLDAVRSLHNGNEQIVAVAVGYDCAEQESEEFIIKTRIEYAVKWRSEPKHAGKIIAFVRGDSDKLHSLNEFDIVTIRSISEQLIDDKIEYAHKNQNMPTRDFWKAIRQTIDNFSFESLYEFTNAVEEAEDSTVAISNNMWRLGLLCDHSILGAKVKPLSQLSQNRNLIIAMSQISEEHRKRLTNALVKAKESDRSRLQAAYRGLQSFFKYGNKETLSALDFETVRDLLSAAKSSKKPRVTTGGDDGVGGETGTVSNIREKQLQKIIARLVVNPECDEEDKEFLVSLLDDVIEHFGDDNNAASNEILTKYEDKAIILDGHDTSLRKLVRLFCTSEIWGGVLETEEPTLRDAVSSNPISVHKFSPESSSSITACDKNTLSLFDCLRKFDDKFKEQDLDNVDQFGDILNRIKLYRNELLDRIDIVMYFPILGFGVSEELKSALINYTEAWAALLRVFRNNATTMFGISHNLTRAAARALLLLDVLYIKTPTEWKAILLPMHPIFLWRYSEVFKSLGISQEFSNTDIENLAEVFTKLPQVLTFVVADSLITADNTNIELPCSGTIEMLPTFENKTNRYLGYDGVECVEEILTRWLAFAPYTGKELRLCTVDAPDHATILKALKDVLGKTPDGKAVYQIFLTRGQNGNTEIAKLDYTSKDYEIGDLIRSGRLSLIIKNVEDLAEVKEQLRVRPVHVAFYFDQSSYNIEHGPSTQELYINPLVVTYDYDYDPMTQRGEIFPSSNMESGIIGDYYRVMRDAELTTANRIPRPTYNPDADIKDLTTTVKDGETIWLIAIDRTISNYLPEDTIPVGEKRCGLRTYGVWTSRDSRIIEQYTALLRRYNLYPQKDILLDILTEFGHISSEGLISIPRFGGNITAIDNRRKGLIGTIFAAKWFTKVHPGSLVASLDTHDARRWLRNTDIQREAKDGKDERADLIGLYIDEISGDLHIVPIEVKTRDDSPDAVVERTGDINFIKGHAADQIESVVTMLKDMFSGHSENMFVSARREVLKYQIVSECFRDMHDHNWKQKWESVLKQLFDKDPSQNITLCIHGLLLHIKLSEVRSGQSIPCIHANNHDCSIVFHELTTDDINREILSISGHTRAGSSIDYDDTTMYDSTTESEFEIDTNIQESSEASVLSEIDLPKAFNDDTHSSDDQRYASSAPSSIKLEEIEQLAKDFKRSCEERGIKLDSSETVHNMSMRATVGASLIRFTFRLARGQRIQDLRNRLEDIGREMQRTGILVQQIPNSADSYLDVPRLTRDKILYGDVIAKLPEISSPELLPFALGKTPDGRDLIKDLKECPHLLVAGSTGSGKTVFLWTLLASLLKTHQHKDDLQLLISSSGLEDFVRFEGLPHLVEGKIYSDASETSEAIRSVVFTEFERRKELLTSARVENIGRYNEKFNDKLAPMVVVVDEFADLTDQLATKKDREDFYKPIRQIVQIGRKRGIHLVLCTQRPSANLLPTDIKEQLGGRVALRVNEATSSRMILGEAGAQDLQKHGDMIYKNGAEIERAQGYLITAEEVDNMVNDVIAYNQQ